MSIEALLRGANLCYTVGTGHMEMISAKRIKEIAKKAVTERTVDVQIVGLRRKLGDWAVAHIETIRGVGYRVKP